MGSNLTHRLESMQTISRTRVPSIPLSAGWELGRKGEAVPLGNGMETKNLERALLPPPPPTRSGHRPLDALPLEGDPTGTVLLPTPTPPAKVECSLNATSIIQNLMKAALPPNHSCPLPYSRGPHGIDGRSIEVLTPELWPNTSANTIKSSPSNLHAKVKDPPRFHGRLNRGSLKEETFCHRNPRPTRVGESSDPCTRSPVYAEQKTNQEFALAILSPRKSPFSMAILAKALSLGIKVENLSL